MQHYQTIRELLDRVRRRWRTLRALQAGVRAALVAAAILGAALVASRWTVGAPFAITLIVTLAALLAAAAIVWPLLPLRRAPTDTQVARFIEERVPALEDRLVSAVDVCGTDRRAAKSRPAPASAFADPMLADAARAARDVDLDAIVPAAMVRRAGFQAVAALLLLGAVSFVGRGSAREALDAVSLTLFPARVTLEVVPGNARIRAGTGFAILARLVGNRAPVIAQLQIADGETWRSADMSTEKPGEFRLALESVTAPFTYRVVAGAVTSPTYDVAVAHAPRVARIDVDYTYPPGLGLKPRTEEDSGDIYAPAGTGVRIRVFTDRPAATGQMALGDGRTIALTADQPNEFSGTLKVVDDNSYRVALADRDGMANPGETEYFIRILEDRPPEVRILKPAADRSVTKLDEVDVEAQAEDDYGVDRLDLVYVLHGVEKVVPLDIPRRSAMVKGHHTLYLEDLKVQPGDFVAYYVRARDLTRGTRPNEARSDIFFLEVKPFEQEFTLAASQAMAGAGGRSSIDDLVVAQKEIVVSTFKLDRRAQMSKGAKSEQDIRSVSRAEAELKARVEQTSSTFRESTMRDPRRRPQGGRGGQPATPRAGEKLEEEDDMAAAAIAMGKAVTSLDALKTGPALPPEMEALTHLLKAQADVKKREVTRQQAGSGSGSNRSNYDVSTLFDKELRKTQQTNYETRSTAEKRDDPNESALDKIKDLAARQDELLKKQQELARDREKLSEEELRRELEKLTRDQSELRQRAEELARQMAGQQSGEQQPSPSQQQNGRAGQSGQQGQTGEQGQSAQRSSAGQQGQSSSQNSRAAGDASQRMRDISEEMRNATSDLRRQNPKQASASGSRALEKLRQLEQRLQSARPDEQRRALGEMQLEARQLADAQRQVASALGRTTPGEAGKDSVRRLAGEQERLAERARRLQDGLRQQAAGAGRSGRSASDPRAADRGSDPAAGQSAAANDAVRELERQRLAERMQQSADAMRATTNDARAGRGRDPSEAARSQASAQQDLARSLDRIADRLASANGAQDDESRKLSAQLARAQELRDKLNQVSRDLGNLSRQGDPGGQRNPGGRSGQQGQGGSNGTSSSSSTKTAGDSGRSGEGQQGGGGGSGTDLARLRDEYARRLQETRDLMDQLRRQDPNGQTFARGGAGFTFEGQGMTLSAPGTEAFKQDFAKWEDMRRQATQALEMAETSLSKKLQARQAKDRLAAGADDKAPPDYQKQVDNYFKAIAKKK
jgi:hypothetical protein